MNPTSKRKAIAKLLQYANKLTLDTHAEFQQHEVADVTIHQPLSLSVIIKQSKNRVNLDHFRAEQSVQESTLEDIRERGRLIEDDEEFQGNKILAVRLYNYALLLKGDDEARIMFIEINISDDLQHQLIIIFEKLIGQKEIDVDFRWLSMEDPSAHSQINSYATNQSVTVSNIASLNATCEDIQMRNMQRQIKDTQAVLTETVMKELDKRNKKLEQLKNNVDAMSVMSENFKKTAQQISNQEEAQSRCFCLYCSCCAKLVKRCPWLACVGFTAGWFKCFPCCAGCCGYVDSTEEIRQEREKYNEAALKSAKLRREQQELQRQAGKANATEMKQTVMKRKAENANKIGKGFDIQISQHKVDKERTYENKRKNSFKRTNRLSMRDRNRRNQDQRLDVDNREKQNLTIDYV